MLLNLSNHPVSAWGEEQIASATNRYGDIVDMPFPYVSPEADEESIQSMALEYAERIVGMRPKGVHLMGELTFSFALVNLLLDKGIPCIASTTHRHVTLNPDGGKTSTFRFVGFRAYLRP